MLIALLIAVSRRRRFSAFAGRAAQAAAAAGWYWSASATSGRSALFTRCVAAAAISSSLSQPVDAGNRPGRRFCRSQQSLLELTLQRRRSVFSVRSAACCSGAASPGMNKDRSASGSGDDRTRCPAPARRAARRRCHALKQGRVGRCHSPARRVRRKIVHPVIEYKDWYGRRHGEETASPRQQPTTLLQRLSVLAKLAGCGLSIIARIRARCRTPSSNAGRWWLSSITSNGGAGKATY